jgi:hypothetical protein
MDRRVISGLTDMKFAPSDQTDVSVMTLMDANGRQGSYHVDKNSLGTLLGNVLEFAADRWKREPDAAVEDICSMASLSRQGISFEPINDETQAVKFKLGEIEMAILIPTTAH